MTTGFISIKKLHTTVVKNKTRCLTKLNFKRLVFAENSQKIST